MADLHESMKRDELDQAARDAGLNPDDYATKAELVAAITGDPAGTAVEASPNGGRFDETISGGKYLAADGKTFVDANGEPVKGNAS